MVDSTYNFCIDELVNPNFDITWSFQYSVSGTNNSTGGFATFLFNDTFLIGGGRYTGLGFAPSQEDYGVANAILGIMFYSNNKIIIKNHEFKTIYENDLFASLSPLVKPNIEFKTIRFNLTNSAQKLIISLKDENYDFYEVLNIDTNLPLPDFLDFYKIGFSYASPLKSGNNKISLKIKDIHYHGSSKIPSVLYDSETKVKVKNYVKSIEDEVKNITLSYNNLSAGSMLYAK